MEKTTNVGTPKPRPSTLLDSPALRTCRAVLAPAPKRPHPPQDDTPEDRPSKRARRGHSKGTPSNTVIYWAVRFYATEGHGGKMIDEFSSQAFRSHASALAWVRQTAMELIIEGLMDDGPDAPGCEAYWDEDGTELDVDAIEANYESLSQALLFGADVVVPWVVEFEETPVEW